jgi:hypothetical protein
MDEESMLSLSSSSSAYSQTSVQLTATDLQLLSLKGSAGDASNKSLCDYEEGISEESTEMVLLFNKIGKCAQAAIQTGQLKPLHIDKEKLSIAKFHAVLFQLSLHLDDDELARLDLRYALTNSSTNGIDFSSFVRDFKRLGKILNERTAKYKMKWRQTTNKINAAGGLPDDGVFLEDLTLTTKSVLRRTSTAAISAERPLERESYTAAAARAAAYSSTFASPFSSARGDDLTHSLRVALQTASEIDSLRGRIPNATPSKLAYSSFERKHTSMIPKLSFRNHTKNLLHARGDKMGLHIMKELNHNPLVSISDANAWLADPLLKISTTTSDSEYHEDEIDNSFTKIPDAKAKLPPLIKPREKFVLPKMTRNSAVPNFMNILDEEDAIELAAKAAAEAAIVAAKEREKLDMLEEEKRVAEAIALIPDPVDSEFDIAMKNIQYGEFYKGNDILIKLIDLVHSSSEAPVGCPNLGILKYYVAKCHLKLGDLVSAKSVIDKCFTPKRMRTIFTDGSATLQDVAYLSVLCMMQVAISSLIAARSLLEKLLSLTEAMLVADAKRSGRPVSNEFLMCTYIELLLLKVKLLYKTGALEASLVLLHDKVTYNIQLLSSFFSEGFEDDR